MGTRRWEEKALMETGDRMTVGKPSGGGKRPKKVSWRLGWRSGSRHAEEKTEEVSWRRR